MVRRARVQDRGPSACRFPVDSSAELGGTLFSRFAEPLPPEAPRERFRAVVHSPRRGRRGSFFPPGPSSVNSPAASPEEGRNRPCRHSQTRFGTPSGTSSGARRPTSSSTSGSSRSSWPAFTGARSTSARRSTSGPRSSERYLPLLRRAAATGVRPERRRRGRGAGLGAARGRAGASAAQVAAAPGRGRPPEPEVHLRAVRDRRRQPLRPRGRARRGRAARPFLQPALPARLARNRQDAPPPRHRQLRRALRRPGSRCATRRSRSSRASSWRRCAARARPASSSASGAPTSC